MRVRAVRPPQGAVDGPVRQVVGDHVGQRLDEERRVVGGVRAAVLDAEVLDLRAQDDVEVVERLDVVAHEPDRYDEDLLPALLRQDAHRVVGLGLQPLAAAAALALEPEAPVTRHDMRDQLGDGLLQLVHVGVALVDGLGRDAVRGEQDGPLVHVAAVERLGSAAADGPHEALARIPALQQRDVATVAAGGGILGGGQLALVPAAGEPRGEGAHRQGDDLVRIQRADAVGDARLGVEEPVAHADGEGELLDQLGLEGERLARGDGGERRGAADERVALLHGGDGPRVRGAPHEALQEGDDLLGALRTAVREQGDVDEALGHADLRRVRSGRPRADARRRPGT